MPQIKTIAALRKLTQQEKYDLVRFKLIAEDAETMDIFDVQAIELDKENRTAIIVVRKQ